MTTFQRARSEEQRAERRRAILGTAAAMLAEMPVTQLSLNELSRRVGLAKSNVLNYFESREAVLLELLDAETREWVAELDEVLAANVDARAPASDRGDQLAATIATTLASRPIFCDLISAQAAVLEHNVSPQVVLAYKHGAIETLVTLVQLIRRQLPEMSEDAAGQLVVAAVMLTGTIWTHAHPAAAVLAAYESEPSLAAMRFDFDTALRDILQILITGILTRQP